MTQSPPERRQDYFGSQFVQHAGLVIILAIVLATVVLHSQSNFIFGPHGLFALLPQAALLLFTVFFAAYTFLARAGLRLRLISAFLLISLPPLSILSLLDQRVTFEALTENSRNAMLTTASRTAESIDAFILANLSTVRTEAMIPQFAQYLSLHPAARPNSHEEKAVMGILMSLKRRDLVNITSIALLDMSGRAMADTYGPGIGLDKSDRDYFLTPKTTGLPHTSPVSLSEPAQQPSLYFSSPVRDTGGRILGFLRFRYNASVLQRMLSSAQDTADYNAVLIDDAGIRLADSCRPDLILTPVYSLAPKTISQLKSQQRLPDNTKITPDPNLNLDQVMLADSSSSFFRAQLHSSESQSTLNVKAHLHNMPWTLVLAYSEAANLAKVDAQSRNALFLVLGIALAVTGGAYFVTKSITQPLLDLTKATRAISLGRKDVTVPLESQDEIGDLASAFNTMSEALHTTHQRLVASGERLQSLLDTLPDTVMIHDEFGAILDVNQSIQKLFGYTPVEVSRMSIEHLSSGGLTQQDAMQRIGASLAQGTCEFEWLARRRDGTEFPVYVRLCRLNLPEGIRVMAVVTDITERKRAEQELEKARNYIANIIDSMPSMLIGVDANIKITQWNRQAEIHTGIPKEHATGQPLSLVIPSLTDEMERIREAIRARRPLTDIKHQTTTENITSYEDMTIYPLIANGVDGAVIRVDDVTERVRMEQMMVQSEKMMSVGGLAAGMAHEINNPLAGIMGNVQNIQNRVFKDMPKNTACAKQCDVSLEKVREYLTRRNIPRMLNDISECSSRAARIVHNMLSFSRKSEANYARHNLGELLDRPIELALNDYDLKQQYDFRKIRIIRRYSPDMPTVHCDGNQIQQVFLNLVKNAAEAMADKTYDSDTPCFILTTGTEDNMAVAEIQDNGPGMEEATRKRVFEPFYTTKAPGKGTGLGLSVSYFIITEQHCGTLEVFSSPGHGTKFVMKLPLGSDR